MNVFLQAARLKLRFATTKGILTVEDLFDLPLTASGGRVSLDSIAMEIFKKRKDAEVPSFVTGEPTKVDRESAIALDVLKEIIEIKKAEKVTAERRAHRNASAQKIMELIETKRNESLGTKTIDELQAELAALMAEETTA